VTPYEMSPMTEEGRRFWVKAITAGGGLGVFGDYAFSDQSRYGHKFSTDVMGPYVGALDDLFESTKGNFDRVADGKDKNIGRDLFRTMKPYTPLSRIWYTKLMVDRLLLDNLERLSDPNFDDRIGKYERKMKKQSGQEFWWAPGESKPR